MKDGFREESGQILSCLFSLPWESEDIWKRGGGTDEAQPSPRMQWAQEGMKAGFCLKEEKIGGQYFLDMDVPQPHFKAEHSSKRSLSQFV